MWSLISKYALEGNTNDLPNGHFYMTKDATERACDEVIDTHYGFGGTKKNQLVQDAMQNLWPKYDVLGEGFIDVDRAAVLLRFAVGNVETGFDLQ